MSTLNLRLDTNLPQLAMALGELREGTQGKILNQSMRDGIRSSANTARKSIVERGNYKKAGKSGAVRKGVSWKYFGQGQGEIKSVGQWWSLVPYVVGRKPPKGDYTRKGLFGVNVVDHFGNRAWKSNYGSRTGFIRSLNGNVHVASGRGSWKNSKIDTVFHMMNPAHVLHHHETFDVVQKQFQTTVENRYLSKYDYEVGKVKGKYGL